MSGIWDTPRYSDKTVRYLARARKVGQSLIRKSCWSRLETKSGTKIIPKELSPWWFVSQRHPEPSGLVPIL